MLFREEHHTYHSSESRGATLAHGSADLMSREGYIFSSDAQLEVTLYHQKVINMKLLPQDTQRKQNLEPARPRHTRRPRADREKGDISNSWSTDDTECLRAVSGGSLDVNEPQVRKHSVGYGYGARRESGSPEAMWQHTVVWSKHLAGHVGAAGEDTAS